jgi:alanine dehydrogenase
MRTGAAGGVAAKYLSRQDSRAAAFIGAGTQARTQLEALLITRPAISSIVVYDNSEANVKDFGEHVYARHALEVEYAASVEEAVRNADIVVTTTPVRSPIVKAEFIRPGTHINAIGADAEGKQELYPAILKRARVVIDNWQQASRSGEINVALSQGIITKDDIYADIGQIVTGQKPARDSDEQITIFDSTGLAIQDISAAAKIFRKLTSDRQIEPQLDTIDFF